MTDKIGQIPKIIFQTWKTSDVPTKWKTSPETIKKYLPQWNYILMTDEDNRKLVADNFPDFLSFYDAFPYNIQRADAIRYCFLYLYGGVYMDLDMELTQSIDPFLESGSDLYFINSGNVTDCLTNSFLISKQGHPLWLKMIEHMKQPLPGWAITKHLKVMLSTGPMALDKVVKSSNYPYTILPRPLFMPCSVCNMDTCDTSNAVIKPLEGQSWNSFDTTALNFCMCNWRKILLVIIVVVIALLAIGWLRKTKNKKYHVNVILPR